MKKILSLLLFGAAVMNLGAYTLGDVNGDGDVTIVDALVIAQAFVGLAPQPYNASAADVNWDERADIVDALIVAQNYVYAMTGYTVYALGQSILTEDDPQVYELLPDMNIRAIQQWSIWGNEPGDYDFSPIARYRQNGISFMGGGTASVIFEGDFASREIFMDMATRDANNALVPHDEVSPGAYRASLANPRYRKSVVDYSKIQIDAGVDGLFFDEVIAGFSGGAVNGYNGNEGFEDYFIADFNKYLIEKYPNYTVQDWKNIFGMSDANIVRKDVQYDDLANNFNYREYLQAHGWNGNTTSNGPLVSQNPLAKEWGTATNNRMYRADTFLAEYTARYWKEIVDELRAYANGKGRHILITSNGIFPFVDLNCLGMYSWNKDEQTPDYRGADYVPVLNGHLNGSKSLMPVYKNMYARNRETSGNVPLVTFIDWPTDMLDNYNSLPLQEKKDYWQIFGAETYGCGLYPAFHLKNTIGSPTATAAGMLDFFAAYKTFYESNNAIYDYLGYRYSDSSVTVSKGSIAQNLMARKDGTRYALHLVNHNYDAGAGGIVAQDNFTVTVTRNGAPKNVSVISPDFAGSKNAAFSYQGNQLTINVDRIVYYNVILIEY